MGLAKYSPTVSSSYAKDQEWFEKNGGGFDNGLNPLSQGDNQGYDSYGYSMYNDRDRAGNTESDYLCDSISNECESQPLYDRTSDAWGGTHTILDLNVALTAKIDSNPAFKKVHDELISVIDIIENVGLVKFSIRKTFSEFGDEDEFNKQNQSIELILKEAQEKFDELSKVIETFYEQSL
jgi:hypothetical protein